MRLAKILPLLFLPVFFALGAGLWLGDQSSENHKKEVELARIQEVTAQAKMLADNLWASLENLKTRVRLKDPTLQDWADLAVTQTEKGPVIREVKSVVSHTDERRFVDQELPAILKLTHLQSLLQGEVEVIRMGRRMAVLFGNGSEILLAIVNPEETFNFFQKWASRSEGGALRAYLIGSDGEIIAHSIPAWNGSNFEKSQIFRDAVGKLFTSARVSGAGSYRSFDQLDTVAAYLRPKPLPLGLVVERVIPPRSVVGLGLGERQLGEWLLTLGLLCAFVFLVAFVLRRQSRTVIAAEQQLPAATAQQEPRVQKVSNTYQAPTLYFTYDENRRFAFQEAAAGFLEGQEPQGLAFALTQESLRDLMDPDSDGQISFSEHPPLIRMMTKLGIGAQDYEAYGRVEFHGGKLILEGIWVIVRCPITSSVLSPKLTNERPLSH